MNETNPNRIRDLIDHLVRLRESSAENTNALVADEVRASGASNRDIALAFSTLTNALQEHLKDSEPSKGLVLCSFCQKSQRDVKTMVQGPTAAICNECVAVCEKTISSPPGLLRKILRKTRPRRGARSD